MKNLFMPCPCWIYTSFSKTLYLACADDDSRRKSDLIPFVYTATTTIYSNATLKLCPSVVFSSHHPTINPICLRLCKLSTNHNPALQFDFKVFFGTEVFHSWTLAYSVHNSEGHSNISLLCVCKLPRCAVCRYWKLQDCRLSRLVAHSKIFRLFMKNLMYVLWPEKFKIE